MRVFGLMNKQNKVKNMGKTGKSSVTGINAPFDTALEYLKNRKARQLNAKEIAYLRMQSKDDILFPTEGSWAKEGVIYLPKEKQIVLVRESIVPKYADRAVKAHKRGHDFSLDKKIIYDFLFNFW